MTTNCRENGAIRMTDKRICKKNCTLFKHRMLGHGMGESKCVVCGAPPLGKECPIDDDTYERRVREELRKREEDDW